MNPRWLILAGIVVAPALVALTQTFSPGRFREISSEEPTAEYAGFNSSFFSYFADPLISDGTLHDVARLSSKFSSGRVVDVSDEAEDDLPETSPAVLTALERWTPEEPALVSNSEDATAPETPSVVFFLPAHVPPPVVTVPPPSPVVRPPARPRERVPMYDTWVKLLRTQPPPKRADEFLPDLKRIFAEEGVPVELAWIPEVESTFNPRALSRKGARGLFQFMPATAREQGLRVRASYDERTNPEKSARAAAILLRQLHEEFDSWPLALAAFNAGGGRVRRSLKASSKTTFADIAHDLPLETRLYVPKVLATLAVREGVSPGALAAPTYAVAEAGL